MGDVVDAMYDEIGRVEGLDCDVDWMDREVEIEWGTTVILCRRNGRGFDG